MRRLISLLAIISSVCLLSACHDFDYYDAPAPPVTVTPGYPIGSNAHYGPPVGRSNAYYDEPVPPVSVTTSGAHYGY